MVDLNQAPPAVRKFPVVAAGGLAVILLFPLAPIPRAAAASNMPWKAELVAAVFLIIGLLLARSARQWGLTIAVPLFWLLTAFTGASALSLLWASSTGWAIHHTLVWGCYIGYLFLFLAWLDQGRRKAVLTTFGILAAALAGMMVLDLTAPDFATDGEFRIRYGKYAELLVTITPVLAAVAFHMRNRMRLIMAVTVWLCGWIGVMLSLSRGALIAGVIAHLVAFTGYLLFSARRRQVVILAASWFVITIAIQFGLSALTTTPTTLDYLTGAMDKARVNVVFRSFSWSVAREMALDNWLIGVGADNFGIAVNDTRRVMAAGSAVRPGLEPFEDYLVERAHNEPLQIAAELGIVGSGILLAAVCWLAFRTIGVLIKRRFRMPPMFWGSLAGVTGFVVSSMVSSFAFRAVQNGVVFFAVLAILLNQIRKASPKVTPRSALSPWRRWRYLGLGFASLLFVFAGSKALAEYTIYAADQTRDEAAARLLYERALRIDPDNAQGLMAYASGVARSDPRGAAELVHTAIARGLGATSVYSRLADYHLQANDTDGVKRAYAEGIATFPGSVFLRVRYALALERFGEQDRADDQMSLAAVADPRHAAAWRILLTEGSVAAYYSSRDDTGVAALSELQPPGAVLRHLDKKTW